MIHDANIAEIDDEALSEAWTRFMLTEIGSDEELAAMTEFQIRLAHLALMPLVGE